MAPEGPGGRRRWATFDCYGTLVDWEAGISGSLGRLWPEVPTRGLLEAYHGIEARVQEGSARPYREVMREVLRRLAAERGLLLGPADEGALGDSLPSWPVFPDAPPALAELRRRGWRLGILSNTDPDLLSASLRRIGVPVDLVVTAAEAGSYKPARGHWDRFRELSGAEPGDHVHVAVSLFHDVAPAAGLGLRAVWVNRPGEVANEPGGRADRTDPPRAAEIPDLTSLPDLLDRIVPA